MARKRVTIEDMRKLARSRGGECLSSEYKNAHSKLLWRCAEGHEWWAEPCNIKNRGSWCPVCAENARLTIEDMQELARSRGGECLSTEYENADSKLQWRCAEGHEWWAKPTNIKHQGNWCPICAGHRRLTIEDMQELARSRGGECLSTEYKNNHSKLLWRCAEGHEWWAKPHNIKILGSWCPICANNKRRISTKNVKKR